MAEFCNRFAGSSDLYETTGRRPYASINFVTAHDGFALEDLVSYNDKHNEANGEDNRDGENYNRSWNCGEEGPANDPEVTRLRTKQKRNFLTTLFLSQGVPMLLGGDEISRTQAGNNNAYCQDNEISWYDWDHMDRGLLEFTTKLIQLRKDHPAFRQRGWFLGRGIKGTDRYDIGWFAADGNEMSEDDWNQGFAKSIGVLINGKEIAAPNLRGDPVEDDIFYVIFNAHHEPLSFTLPAVKEGELWEKVLDTSEQDSFSSQNESSGAPILEVDGRSVVLLVLLEKRTF